MQNERLWKADCGDGTYNNPILFADYSDPDVIRVGDTFYMTASSFNYTPGLPILISKDLVNWELKNYAVTNINYERYLNPAHAKGIWAPAIRYHNNKYWISYGMPDEGIFIICAENPLGKWSDPILLLEGKGFIDPCPFWDNDGRGYIIHGYAKSRIGFKSILGLFPIDVNGTKAIGDDRFIYDGSQTQQTIEGPKVYKRKGWYYIFAPAGGVKTGWQTVLRSRYLEGPFEERIVMQQGDSITNGPHQGALIDTASGEEWFVHFQDRGFYGRITHLQPVRWVEDWPIIGVNHNSEGWGEPCVHYEKPKGTVQGEVTYLDANDDFDKPELALQWQWLGNHIKEFYSLDERIGFLRLYSQNPSGDIPVTLWNSSNVLTQKFVCPMFEADMKLDFQGLADNEQTGCVVMGGSYVYMAIRKKENQCRFVYVKSDNAGELLSETVLFTKPIEKGMSTITFRVVLKQEDGIMIIRMLYAFDNLNFIDTGFIFEPSDHTWVGAKLGLFSLALNNEKHEGYSDFEYIQVKNLSKGEL